jgi:transposase InsO family protein
LYVPNSDLDRKDFGVPVRRHTGRRHSAGWGWFYLSTILDDFSRYVVAWKLCTNTKYEYVTATVEMALEATGLDKAKGKKRPRLLSDNGGLYVSAELGQWLSDRGMAQVHGKPGHPQTQGKIELWHQPLKNRILLEIITCRAISRYRSVPSSTTITTIATTRASAM